MTNPQRIVRRIRTLEYIGPEDWVRTSSEGEERYVKGEQVVGPNKRIVEGLGSIFYEETDNG